LYSTPLREFHDQTGHTTLFVTHDQEEAFELADRVAILDQGRVEQVGAPRIIQTEPASAFVAAFVEGTAPCAEAHPGAENRAKSAFLCPGHAVSDGLTSPKKNPNPA
jgi:sulfate/thiosulfate transport system ATP-binding protein